MKYLALIPAAGRGERMQLSRPKQYLSLQGHPLLWHAISSLSRHPKITDVAVILDPEDTYFVLSDYKHIVGFDKVRAYYCGGATRAQTVYHGLQAVADQIKSDSWVLVHDAARPCLSKRILDKLIQKVEDHPIGGILALPLSDTLKVGNTQKQIVKTLPRETLWRAQTPQMFRYHLLYEALAQYQEVTDEASAIEALGHAPLLVEGSSSNLKVTYPEDWHLAQAILAQWQYESIESDK